MRRDARAHRQRLVEAAACVFRRDGCDVPLEVILAETGLGRGTLYRHFANRTALIRAVMELELERLSSFVEGNIGRADLLVAFVRRQGLLTMSLAPFMMRLPADEVRALCAPMEPRVGRLFDRVVAQARAMGVVGPDFAAIDLRLANLMLLSASDEDPARESELFDRALAIVLRGMGVRCGVGAGDADAPARPPRPIIEPRLAASR